MLLLFAATVVFLDPGHGPDSPGATSARGIPEFRYNQEWAARLEGALRAVPGIEVKRTRRDGQALALAERAERANSARAALLLSIHHDAAGAGEKLSWTDQGKAREHQLVARGYSLHVRGDRPESVAAALAISRAISAAGFAPAEYHRRHYRLVEGTDASLAIYDRPELGLLRRAKVPAVILELGFIDHLEEEASLATPEVRARLLEAIVRGVREAAPKPQPEAAR
ncbi:MAG: N-acetylmuramoyl-L-alanine amidase [Myxococcales bacterium]|nr:N-acetylmuramoyl-L-alanine amidase [Myxococcales bacterium]